VQNQRLILKKSDYTRYWFASGISYPSMLLCMVIKAGRLPAAAQVTISLSSFILSSPVSPPPLSISKAIAFLAPSRILYGSRLPCWKETRRLSVPRTSGYSVAKSSWNRSIVKHNHLRLTNHGVDVEICRCADTKIRCLQVKDKSYHVENLFVLVYSSLPALLGALDACITVSCCSAKAQA
jgi:hypothetical protein